MAKKLNLVLFLFVSLFVFVLIAKAQTTDTTAPVLTNYRAENVNTGSVLIKWDTDDPSDSQLSYGTSTANLSTFLGAQNRCDTDQPGFPYVIHHCIYINGLNPSTNYYYKAQSTNSASLWGYVIYYFSTTSTGGSPPPPSPSVTPLPTPTYYPSPTYHPTVTPLPTTTHTPTPYPTYPPPPSVTPSTNLTPTPRPSYTPYPSTYPTYTPVPTEKPTFTPLPSPVITLVLTFTPTPTPIPLPIVKTITGTITFSNGNPVTDANVGAYSKDTGQWISTSTDSKGNYTLNISGGAWVLGVSPKNSSMAWKSPTPYPEVNFEKNSTPESATQNVTIPALDSHLSVTTVDNQGNPIPSAGIVADVNSAATAGTPTTNSVGANFTQTDSQGHATMTLKSGTYYVRAFLPETAGYIKPVEQSVSIGSGETKEVKLIFIKANTVTPLLVKGKTSLDDGRPIDAFVWAWSEKGRTISGNADLNGEFSLQISPNDNWHLGAGKLVDGFPYKSSEIVLSVTDQTVSADLVLSRLPDETVLSSSANTVSVTQDSVTQTDSGAKVVLPANSVSASGNVTVQVNPTVEVPSQPSARVFGAAYDVKVKDTLGNSLKQFTKDVQVELPYDPDQLKKQNLSEDSISPSYFDDATGTWVKISNYTIDKTRKVIIARVNHLTLFAVVLAADIVPPVPPSGVKASASGQGQISLTWVNPGSDFDHATIYRSENPGSLGKLEGSVSGSSFIDDAGLKDGVTYYYVIRAVDPASNETSNTTSTAIRASGNSSKTSNSGGLKDGDMISAAGSNDPDVYIINSFGYKRLFLNPVIFGFYGHLGGFNNVKKIDSSSRDSYVTSGLFRNCETNDPKVYGVETTGEDTGTLHWINISGDEAVAEDSNFFKKVFCINNNEFNWYSKGATYTSLGQVPNYSRK